MVNTLINKFLKKEKDMNVTQARDKIKKISKLDVDDISEIIDNREVLLTKPQSTVEELYKNKLLQDENRVKKILEVEDPLDFNGSEDLNQHTNGDVTDYNNNKNTIQPVYQEYETPSRIQTVTSMTTTSRPIDNYMYNVQSYGDVLPEVAPIQINIDDEDGLICSKINQVEDKFELSVLPIELLDLPWNLRKIKDHVMYKLGNTDYVAGTERLVSRDRIDSFERALVKLISSNDRDIVQPDGTISLSMLMVIKHENKSIQVPKFNIKEVKYLISRFKDYSPQVVTSESLNTRECVYNFVVKAPFDYSRIGRRLLNE